MASLIKSVTEGINTIENGTDLKSIAGDIGSLTGKLGLSLEDLEKIDLEVESL